MKNVILKKIETEAVYRTILQQVYHLMDAKEGTIELDLLEEPSELVEEYEKVHYPIRKS